MQLIDSFSSLKMDDDGLLLNFAAPDSNASSKSSAQKPVKVSGGRWKDRRKLQLSLLGRGRNKRAETGVNKESIAQPRDLSSSKPQSFREEQLAKRPKYFESRGEGGKNETYVSSLFTSNTKSKLENEKVEEEKTYLPSNAPMKGADDFNGLGLNDNLVHHLTESLRFKNPTQIQKSVIPSLLSTSRDLFVKAQTGSGKTLSFLLPIFHKLMQEKKNPITRESGVFAIVLVPTRELANQIYGVLETLTRCHHQIVPGIVIGGEKKKSEKARIRKGANILVATPGRLADHIENTTSLDLSQLRYLILDEGDRLIDLGFEETITKITDTITRCSRISESTQKWQGLPTKRVNVLCSATMENNVEKLGSIILNNPEQISIDTSKLREGDEIDSKLMAPAQLTQRVVVVPAKLRLVTLSAVLKEVAKTAPTSSTEIVRTIVFFSCSDSVNFHYEAFKRNGSEFRKARNAETNRFEMVTVGEDEANAEGSDTEIPKISSAPTILANSVVYKLHGSLTQQVRTSTLQSFVQAVPFDNSENNYNHLILLCTDVASRGLDLPNISSVVEYDPPFSVQDHLHRIGRTARLGNKGSSYLFLLPGIEEGYVDGKIRVVHPEGSIRITNYETILQNAFGDSSEIKNSDPKSKQGKWDMHATTWHLDIERWLLEDAASHESAKQAFTSHIRAYATHLSSEKTFFNVKTLHLGHLAKSFGLREPPKKLGSLATKSSLTRKEYGEKSRKLEDPRKKMLRMAKLAASSASSEFNY